MDNAPTKGTVSKYYIFFIVRVDNGKKFDYMAMYFGVSSPEKGRKSLPQFVPSLVRVSLNDVKYSKVSLFSTIIVS